ncbi:MAG: hypothetical protein KDI22_03520 [Gammaproteobacteria bacterium]|nr:hypothetical protein [Gammaproteobacteria bacterium]MCP5316929.1 hypothetical protein [Chromatiaceae bacterium]MCW5586111.1 hypothetical protein [Chromatiales bacterium]MCB1817384.1 hypothetical protein [Gammaproteobacteria bacterium]MCP5428809.1 hypothetical protein [Chromatiaceae bacterium]
MIETKEQLLASFSEKAQSFLDNPGLVSGIDFDDAAVTLKRYVLSQLHDQALGSKLAQFPKLIRQLDVATLTGLVAEIEARLATSGN